MVATLLSSGATVVALTSSPTADRRRSWRELERRHGGPGARLFVVPANLASFRDVGAVIDWLHDPAAGRASDPSVHPGRPDVVVPFAAPTVLGDAADAGARQEVELRVMLLGVERLVARCAELRDGPDPRDRRDGRPEVLTAVLPLSPNHGLFGGDGAYGHAKAGLEVLATRRAAEAARWGDRCRIVGVEIGWVRGTGLMSAHDDLAPLVEESLGITTHDAADVGRRIAGLCVPADEPGEVRVELTGGLGDVDPAALAALVRAGADRGRSEETDRPTGSDRRPGPEGGDRGGAAEGRSRLRALPGPRRSPREPRPVAVTGGPTEAAAPGSRTGSVALKDTVALEDMVVLCGVAEVGPWGTSLTRADVERQPGLPARTVLELAVHCGLIEWAPSGSAGSWVDTASGDDVDEADVAGRYRDLVAERCGIRSVAQSIDAEMRVFTERPVTVAVGSAADAGADRRQPGRQAGPRRRLRRRCHGVDPGRFVPVGHPPGAVAALGDRPAARRHGPDPLRHPRRDGHGGRPHRSVEPGHHRRGVPRRRHRPRGAPRRRVGGTGRLHPGDRDGRDGQHPHDPPGAPARRPARQRRPPGGPRQRRPRPRCSPSSAGAGR